MPESGGRSGDVTEQWDSDYDERNDWCEGCDDLFNADSLEGGLCARCRYLDTEGDH